MAENNEKLKKSNVSAAISVFENIIQCENIEIC